MSVVLRCPHCGTTRATPGGCEACHEAEVRYFCTNHEPGQWLDGRTCPTCAARPASATPPPRPAIPVTRPAVRASAPPPLPRFERPEAPSPEALEWAERERRRPADDGLDPRGAREPLFLKLLKAAAVARSMRTAAAPVGASIGKLGGCLTRLVLFGLVLVVSLVTAVFFFGRSLL